MKITILSLFPDMFAGVFGESILKRARELGAVEIEIVDFRDFATNKHRHVDDYAFGGGAGMVLSVEPIHRALQSIAGIERAVKILLTPQGRPFDQAEAIRLSKADHLVMICGHYEGFDERVRSLVDLEISIGDYVLTGGEIAAMAIADSVIRLLPGVLGSPESAPHDSFYDGLLEHPQYTRPVEYMGMRVPDVLLSGNHAEIDRWRREQSLKRTMERRPDLLKKR
ncbi:MAG: tRNA (guanosine(37)-N1)-methyltransferase TrmD [Candidatus Izemoplasmatales bacterium]